MKRKNLFLSLCIVMCNLSMVVNAQAVKVFNDANNETRAELTAQTIVYHNGEGDGLDVVTSRSSTELQNGGDLIWGAFAQYQPNNPGIFSLMSLSAVPWSSCFKI